jgi:hypothetical protein
VTAIASPFPYSKGAVIADIFAGCEVYVGIYGTCTRKLKGGLLYQVRLKVKSAKNGKVELVVPPLTLDESIMVTEVVLTTKQTPISLGNCVRVETNISNLTVTAGDTLYIKPIEITIT